MKYPLCLGEGCQAPTHLNRSGLSPRNAMSRGSEGHFLWVTFLLGQQKKSDSSAGRRSKRRRGVSGQVAATPAQAIPAYNAKKETKSLDPRLRGSDGEGVAKAFEAWKQACKSCTARRSDPSATRKPKAKPHAGASRLLKAPRACIGMTARKIRNENGKAAPASIAKTASRKSPTLKPWRDGPARQPQPSIPLRLLQPRIQQRRIRVINRHDAIPRPHLPRAGRRFVPLLLDAHLDALR